MVVIGRPTAGLLGYPIRVPQKGTLSGYPKRVPYQGTLLGYPILINYYNTTIDKIPKFGIFDFLIRLGGFSDRGFISMN